MNKIKKTLSMKISLFNLIILYRLTLDWIYFNIISKEFWYEGFIDNRSVYSFFVSWACLIISFILAKNFFLKKETNRVSSIVISILYLVSYVPFTTCIYANAFDQKFIIFNNIYWLLLLLITNAFIRKEARPFRKVKIGDYNYKDYLVLLIGIFSFTLVLFISAKYTNFRLNFNLFQVYDLRFEARSYSIPAFFKYIFAWTKAINPILMAYCFINKKYFVSILFFLSQLFSFGIDGVKSTFFMLIIVIIIFVIYNDFVRNKIEYIISLGLLTINLLAILEKIFFKSILISHLFIRRIDFSTNFISSYYFDYFTNNIPDYFRSSFLRYFGLSSPYLLYDRSLGEFIGRKYMREGINLNNGLISDAVANIGIIGIFIMPFFVILVLRLFDRSTVLLDDQLKLVTSIYISLTLLSSFLNTALLTHGLLILIIVLSNIERNVAVRNEYNKIHDT